MKTKERCLAVAFLALAFAFAFDFGARAREAAPAGTVPAGTIIPAMLRSSISSAKTKPGEPVSARVMQDVPLPNGMKIREGAKITGYVTQVHGAAAGTGGSIWLVFDGVRSGKRALAIRTDLRAIASLSAVDSAKIPAFGMGEGETWNNRVTTQIGGDTVYWGGGPVIGRFGEVGKPVSGAAISGVLARVTAAPEKPCRGEMDDNHSVQALWVFSSDACGAYGLYGLEVAHAGRTEPLGLIELSARSGEVKVSSGSGLLLRVLDNRER